MKYVPNFRLFESNQKHNEILSLLKADDKLTMDEAATLLALVGRTFKLAKPMRDVDKVKVVRIDDWNGVSVDYEFSTTMNGRRGRAESSLGWKEFLEYVPKKFMISYEDPTVEVETEPTKKAMKMAKGYGTWDTEFAPGGFPTKSELVFDKNKTQRLEKIVDKMMIKREVIELAMAFAGLYGMWSTGTTILMNKCRELDCTKNELASIEAYNNKFKESRNVSIA